MEHALLSVPLLPTPAAAAVLLFIMCVSRPNGGFFFFPLPALETAADTSIFLSLTV